MRNYDGCICHCVATVTEPETKVKQEPDSIQSESKREDSDQSEEEGDEMGQSDEQEESSEVSDSPSESDENDEDSEDDSKRSKQKDKGLSFHVLDQIFVKSTFLQNCNGYS